MQPSNDTILCLDQPPCSIGEGRKEDCSGCAHIQIGHMLCNDRKGRRSNQAPFFKSSAHGVTYISCRHSRLICIAHRGLKVAFTIPSRDDLIPCGLYRTAIRMSPTKDDL